MKKKKRQQVERCNRCGKGLEYDSYIRSEHFFFSGHDGLPVIHVKAELTMDYCHFCKEFFVTARTIK